MKMPRTCGLSLPRLCVSLLPMKRASQIFLTGGLTLLAVLVVTS
jgi:hypothetical protein